MKQTTRGLIVVLAVAAGVAGAGSAGASVGADVVLPGAEVRYDDPTNSFVVTDTACDGQGVSVAYRIDNGPLNTFQHNKPCGTTSRYGIHAEENLPLLWRACVDSAVGPGRCSDWVLEDV